MGDVDGFQSSIGAAARGPADGPAVAKVGDALRQLGGQDMIDAHMAHGQLADYQNLTQHLNNLSGVTGWLSDPSQAFADAKVGTAPGAFRVYSPAGRQAMEDLANQAPGPIGQAMQSLAARGINMGTHAALGGGVGALVGDPALGTLLGAERMGTGGIGGYLTRAFTNPAARRAILAARAATSSGQPATAAMYRNAPWLSQAARPGVYAAGAANTFGGGGS